MPNIKPPVSYETARLRMLDTTGVMVVSFKSFMQPAQEGNENLNIFVSAFLVEHKASGRKVMFDLGIRKDYWQLPTGIQQSWGSLIKGVRIEKDTTEVLQEGDVALDQISSVIWSHYHWDHTGSMHLFPKTTELVVGPGVRETQAIEPGFPEDPKSVVNAEMSEGRSVNEISFEETGIEIGGFRAHDFFGDGSFYLLDTPGHCIGHMCGLVRTTGGEGSTFAFLGGDICHSPAMFRPSPSIPLPDPIPSGVLDDDPFFPSPCPRDVFTKHHPKKSSTSNLDPSKTPFYDVSTDATSGYADPATSQVTANKLVHFDSDPFTLICIAHDEAMLRTFPTFNENPEDDLNQWKERGYKEMIRWNWLNDLPRDGRAGRPLAVDGFWRDGKPWPEATKLSERSS